MAQNEREPARERSECLGYEQRRVTLFRRNSVGLGFSVQQQHYSLM